MRISGILFGLAAALGLAAFIAGYEAAFPAAAIELEVPRGELRARADEYIRQLGVEPDTFRSSLTFEVDGEAAVFLQRVRGLEALNRFATEELPLWSWRARWFRSGATEEFRLRLAPDGSPLRFQRVLPETAPGDSISQDSARALASAFLSGELGIDVAGWRLEDQSTQVRDHRIDHTFTWRRPGSDIEWRPGDPAAGTASIQLTAVVQGSEIGVFSQFLKVPERFSRELQQTTAVGQLLALASLALMFVLVVIAAVVAIARYKRDRVRWRPGILAGAAVSITFLLIGLLSFPLIASQYSTEIAYPVFVATAVIGALVIALMLGAAVGVSATAGESLAAETFPGGLRAFRDWMAGHWLTRAAASEVLRGYAVAFAFLGYLTVFYLVGRRALGIWLPVESPHNQLLGMYLPWLVPLLVGVQASVSEEVVLRLFGVSVTKRYLRYTFLALLLPAIIWAFGHSTYPVYPVYVRGIELTIAGVFFGWIFIRYGLVAMLVAHFAIDAILLAMPFLRAAVGSYVGYGLAALLIAALPLLIPALVAVRGRRAVTVAGTP